MIVERVEVHKVAYRAETGQEFATAGDAYAHVAAWRIAKRDWDDGRKAYIGPPKLVARLARYLRWLDERETR